MVSIQVLVYTYGLRVSSIPTSSGLWILELSCRLGSDNISSGGKNFGTRDDRRLAKYSVAIIDPLLK